MLCKQARFWTLNMIHQLSMFSWVLINTRTISLELGTADKCGWCHNNFSSCSCPPAAYIFWPNPRQCLIMWNAQLRAETLHNRHFSTQRSMWTQATFQWWKNIYANITDPLSGTLDTLLGIRLVSAVCSLLELVNVNQCWRLGGEFGHEAWL